jgi:hypothetical protein
MTNRPVHGGGGEGMRAPSEGDWILRHGKFIDSLVTAIRAERRRTG